MSFTTPGIVRKLGGLPKPPSAGHVKDEQIDSAIIWAELQMRKLKLKTDYDTVLAYTSSATAEQKAQRTSYEHAEASYSCGRLPNILTSSQLAATGLIQTREVGKETRSFASKREKDEIAADWIKQAIDHLAPYLVTNVADTAGKTIAVTSKNKGLSIMAI